MSSEDSVEKGVTRRVLHRISLPRTTEAARLFGWYQGLICGTIPANWTSAMDDSPKEFVEEFKSAILKKRVGQIALAVVLAEACIRFLNSIVWYVVIPLVALMLEGHTESVFFRNKPAVAWSQLFGSILEFSFAIIFVFYVNRWIRGSLPEPTPSPEVEVPALLPQKEPEIYYNLAGQPLSPTEQDRER